MKQIRIKKVLIIFRKLGITIMNDSGEFGFCIRKNHISVFLGNSEKLFYYKN